MFFHLCKLLSFNNEFYETDVIQPDLSGFISCVKILDKTYHFICIILGTFGETP
jgi:hypothetical protein